MYANTNKIHTHLHHTGGTENWSNPADGGIIRVQGSAWSKGRIEDVCISTPHVNCDSWSLDAPDAWFAVELPAGLLLDPTHYTIRHGYAGGAQLRNWQVRACMLECVCVCVCVCVCMRVSDVGSLLSCVYMFVCVCVYIYIYIYIYVHIYIHTHICIYIHTYIYIQLLVSSDGDTWRVARTHTRDGSLVGGYAVHTWPIQSGAGAAR
jgi:hypothetical protein